MDKTQDVILTAIIEWFDGQHNSRANGSDNYCDLDSIEDAVVDGVFDLRSLAEHVDKKLSRSI